MNFSDRLKFVRKQPAEKDLNGGIVGLIVVPCVIFEIPKLSSITNALWFASISPQWN